MDARGLAEFLRARRVALHPGDVGLTGPPARARRTPGLRREEVAALAGVSVSYYERLEQARGPHPSPAVLGALARALRLSEPERAHLSRLAGDTPTGHPPIPEAVPAPVRALLDRLGPVPAYLTNARQDVLAWNDLAVTVVVDFAALAPEDRNVSRLSMRPDLTRCGAPAGHEHRFVDAVAGQLRAAVARHPGDDGLRRLVEDLLAGSPGFGESWARHDVRPPAVLHKRIDHPELGLLELDQQTLAVPGAQLSLVLLTAAPGSATDRALHRLADRASRTGPVGSGV